ncbi:uncharacterized protein EDB93DRAFT_1147968 [Suillus bovinus]|uniref:uncharacterized protein n=1 Tax=Suillus bovinus TaxID=48563 RepID=UPI001B872FD5|nr:uncharacterized protein EDB93DRAFT_1147968 [Suillus bovinus]KAG2146899.1 hypothetical protein EDB93DRAFT_1147968 [Suillus bovinus]
MSSNTSASPPPIETLPASSSKTKKTAAKKPASKKAPAKAAPKVASHPSWKDIIKASITAHKEDARSGVSRATIKKFAEESYHIEVSGTNLYQLNRAITSGVTAGIFALPKGPSGKVKLAPKKKASDDENSKPVSVKKVAVKPASKKAPAPVKKADAPAKKTATKKPTTASKAKKPASQKTTPAATKKAATAAAPKKTVPKKATAGAPTKKPAVKSAAPAKKASTAKMVEKKKVAAKAAATKAAKKPTPKAKSSSSRARKVSA